MPVGFGRPPSIPRPVVVIGGIVTVTVIIVSAILLLVTRMQAPAGFDGDEARHAMWGAAVYLDLAQGDVWSFLRHTYAQNRYPPLYSWMQIPTLAIMGITPLAHRMVGIISLVILCGSIYLCITWASNSKNAWVGACIGALLVMSCPELLSVATRVYMEPASLALMMLTYGLYLRAYSSRSTRLAWGAGILHLLSWFLKWQFGLLISITLVLHLIAKYRLQLRKIAADPVAQRTLLPAWVGMLCWLANPYQLRELLMYLTQSPKKQSIVALVTDGLWVQVRLFFSAYNATTAAAVLGTAGLVYGVFRARRPAALLYSIGIVAAVGATASLNTGEDLSGRELWPVPPVWAPGGSLGRHGLWLLPPVWVLVGLAVNEGVSKLITYTHRLKVMQARAVLGAVVLILVGAAVGNIGAGWGRASGRVTGGHAQQSWQVLSYVARTVSPDRRICTAGCWTQKISPRALKWAYLAQYGPAGLGYDDVHLWEYPPPDPHEKDVLHFCWPWRVRLPREGPVEEPDPVTVLQQAAIDTLIVRHEIDRPLAPWQRRIVQAAKQMGLTQAGEFAPPQMGQQLTVYVLDENNRGK